MKKMQTKEPGMAARPPRQVTHTPFRGKLQAMLLTVMLLPVMVIAQVRPSITSFTPAQRTQLATLMMQYITPAVVEDHCMHQMIMGGHIHSDFNFLPFHRMYLERLEDYLLIQGYPQFVPLPSWNPEAGGVPAEFQVVDPDCSSAACDPGHPASSCGATINWNPGNALPSNLKLPVVAGANNDLCDYFMLPTTPINDNGTTATGLSRKIENPWHDGVHVSMSGVMGNFRSPAAPIFWLWHAYVDDVWKKWECNCTQSGMVGDFDLYMKDNHMIVPAERDRGEEPDIDMGPMWESQDIWVRNQNDGFTDHTHQNPEYMAIATNYNYVYVQVRNRGCVPTTGTENLQLSWAKAGTALSWPNFWNGSITSPALMGDEISTQTIPVIQPGASVILEFPWQPANPATYAAIGTDPIFWANEPWHFCLLARVLAAGDPMTFTETSDLNGNVRNNNNIVWKNLTVVDLNPSNIVNPGGWNPGDDKLVGAVIQVGDINGGGGFYDFVFQNPIDYQGNPLTAEAEIKITLDAPVWDKWKKGGFVGKNVAIARDDRHQIILKGSPAIISNLYFGKGEISLMHVGFNFLTEQASGQKTFDFQVFQKQSGTAEALGGERFHLNVPGRALFTADAGADQAAASQAQVTFQATDIGEPAIYNWYAPGGTLVFTGDKFTTTATGNETYKLEVIALADGYKDYDDVSIIVTSSVIVSVSPNPASGNVTVEYHATGATSAYLVLQEMYTGAQSKYPLNPSLPKTTLNIAALPPSVYSVILFCDGIQADTETLIIQ